MAGVVAAITVWAAPGAKAAEYAPVERPGPPLSVPRAALDRSLRCPAHLSSATREVVLLIPGTTVDPPEAFGWNSMKALDAEGIPHCDVTVPNHTDGDIQIASSTPATRPT